MKRAAWINLALFIAVVALGAFVYFKPKHEMPAFTLSTLTADDVNAFKIENAGISSAQAIVLVHVNHAWQITKPIAARADDFQIARVLNILNATSDTELSADNLDHFNLAAPQTQLTIDGKHDEQTFAFGMFNELTHQQYVLTNNHVYLVGLQYGMALPKDAYQLVDKKLFADNETADEMPASFEFPQFKLEQNNGEWKLTPQARDYSQDDFNRWVEDWTHASALAVLPRDAFNKNEKNAKPAFNIKVTLKNNKVITLHVLQTKPAFLIARDDAPALLYQFSPDIADHLLNAPDVSKNAGSANTGRIFK